MAETIEISGEVTISQPISYSFRFKPYGWAILTLNEATGEVSLNSDWGNYSHRWHIGHIGTPSLHDFFIKAGSDYLANKFSYENKTDLKDVVDEERTKAFVRERIAEHLSDGLITEAEDQELDDQLEAWAQDDFTTEACQPELYKFLAHESHEYIQTKRSARYEFLVGTLLPFIQKYLKEYVAKTAPIIVLRQE